MEYKKFGELSREEKIELCEAAIDGLEIKILRFLPTYVCKSLGPHFKMLDGLPGDYSWDLIGINGAENNYDVAFCNKEIYAINNLEDKAEFDFSLLDNRINFVAKNLNNQIFGYEEKPASGRSFSHCSFVGRGEGKIILLNDVLSEKALKSMRKVVWNNSLIERGGPGDLSYSKGEN